MALLSSALGALAGGAVDFFSGQRAEDAGERSLQQARSDQSYAFEINRRGYERALPFMNQQLDEASSLEDDLLGLVDPVTANEIRRIRQEERYMQSMQTAEMGMRGLDSFTTRQGAQAGVFGQAQNALSELSARMAAQRMGAMSQGRGAYMNALGQRARFEQGLSDRQAGVAGNLARIQANVQYQPAQGGAGFGRFARDISQLALDQFDIDL